MHNMLRDLLIVAGVIVVVVIGLFVYIVNQINENGYEQ